MKISDVIKELENIKNTYGDIECELQDDDDGELTKGYESFFIIPEKYSPDEEHSSEYWECNIRWWPY
jgi:hypothetical protein